MNDTFFSNSFNFRQIKYTNAQRIVDNTSGVGTNFLALMLDGCGRLQMKDREIIMHSGDVFFIPYGCKYKSIWQGDPTVEFVSLAFKHMPLPEGRYYPPQIIDADGESVRLIKWINEHKEVNADSIAALYTLIARLLPVMEFNTGGRGDELVSRVERLIYKNPEYTVKELARECAVSESALYSAFKRHSERSMNEIKRGVMMERARELLISTDLSIEEISRRLGFSSGAYLRKCFSEYFGAPPREIRRKQGV